MGTFKDTYLTAYAKLGRIARRFGTVTIGWDAKRKVFFIDMPGMNISVDGETTDDVITKSYKALDWTK